MPSFLRSMVNCSENGKLLSPLQFNGKKKSRIPILSSTKSSPTHTSRLPEGFATPTRKTVEVETQTQVFGIDLSIETRLQYLERMNKTLLLKLTLLEPVALHVKRLQDQVDSLSNQLTGLLNKRESPSVSVECKQSETTATKCSEIFSRDIITDKQNVDQTDKSSSIHEASSEVKSTHTSSKVIEDNGTNDAGSIHDVILSSSLVIDTGTADCFTENLKTDVDFKKSRLKSLYVRLSLPWALPWASTYSLKSYIKMFGKGGSVKCYKLRGGVKPSFRVCVEPDVFDLILNKLPFPFGTFCRPYSATKPG